MQLFPKTLDGFYMLAISAKSSILDVWIGCEKASGSKLRSNQPTLQWKTHCFFCNKKVIIDDSKHKNQYQESRRVEVKEYPVQFIHKIRKRCNKRNENFATNMWKRLSIDPDLFADEVVCNTQCHSQFPQCTQRRW